MPQLDVVSYVAHYSWTLIFLLTYFFFLVNVVLPNSQKQIAIRNKLQWPLTVTHRTGIGPKVDIFKTLLGVSPLHK